MEKLQKKVEDLHQMLSKELEDDDLHPVLRATFLGIRKELEAFPWALNALGVEAVSDRTAEVNAAIEADWADPDVQVDPNVPHVFREDEPAAQEPDEAPAGEPALD